MEVRRTQVSLAALTKAATEAGTIFAGAVGGGFVFPRVPARLRRRSRASATCCSCSRRWIEPLSALVDELPRPARRPPGGPLPVGAQGNGDAAADRADEGARRPTCSTGSRCSRRTAGRRSSRTPTSPSSTSMRKGRPRTRPTGSKPSSTALVEEIIARQEDARVTAERTLKWRLKDSARSCFTGR